MKEEVSFISLKEKAINLLKQFKGSDYTFGIGVLDQIGTIASQFGKSALLVSNTTCLKPVADKVIELLKNKGITLAGNRVVPDAKPNNPWEDVYRFTTSMPPVLAIDDALDGISHCLEVFYGIS